jgi:hypothetical protein
VTPEQSGHAVWQLDTTLMARNDVEDTKQPLSTEEDGEASATTLTWCYEFTPARSQALRRIDVHFGSKDAVITGDNNNADVPFQFALSIWCRSKANDSWIQLSDSIDVTDKLYDSSDSLLSTLVEVTDPSISQVQLQLSWSSSSTTANSSAHSAPSARIPTFTVDLLQGNMSYSGGDLAAILQSSKFIKRLLTIVQNEATTLPLRTCALHLLSIIVTTYPDRLPRIAKSIDVQQMVSRFTSADLTTASLLANVLQKLMLHSKEFK